MTKKVAIVSAARTAMANFMGSLKTVPAENLFSIVLKACLERAGGLDPMEVESVQCGQVEQSMTCNNPGRWCAVDIGAMNAPGMTTNRICGSGYQAMVSAWQEIVTGHVDIALAGGTESLSRANFYLPSEFRFQGLGSGKKKIFDPNEEAHMNASPLHYCAPEWMGVTADRVAQIHNISREDSDRFAYEAQMKNKKAMEEGKFDKEIVPVPVDLGKKKGIVMFDKDEFGKPETTMESLGKLRPAFSKDGVVTAGTATGFNDGAAAVLMMSDETAKKKGLTPMAYMVDYAIGVCEPNVMGLAPGYGIPKLLKQTNLSHKDIDLYEINEAFAAQVLGCLRVMDVYPFDGGPNAEVFYPKLNPYGNGLAMGHPLGATGARIATTALYQMVDKNYKRCIISACIGGGMAVTILLERP